MVQVCAVRAALLFDSRCITRVPAQVLPKCIDDLPTLSFGNKIEDADICHIFGVCIALCCLDIPQRERAVTLLELKSRSIK